jgi:hypothetical protein
VDSVAEHPALAFAESTQMPAPPAQTDAPVRDAAVLADVVAPVDDAVATAVLVAVDAVEPDAVASADVDGLGTVVSPQPMATAMSIAADVPPTPPCARCMSPD